MTKYENVNKEQDCLEILFHQGIIFNIEAI